ALDELRVRRVLRVDDVHAGVRAADVDGRALPGDAPHRLGEITVVDAGDVHRLHVPRIAHVGDVPDVDPLAADGRGVEGAAVLREGDLVPLRLAAAAVLAVAGALPEGEQLGRRGIREIVEGEQRVPRQLQVAVDDGRLVVVADLEGGGDEPRALRARFVRELPFGRRGRALVGIHHVRDAARRGGVGPAGPRDRAAPGGAARRDRDGAPRGGIGDARVSPGGGASVALRIGAGATVHRKTEGEREAGPAL